MKMKKQYAKNHIAIAMGDPAGIGMEVILKALGSNKLPNQIEPLIVGCKKQLNRVYSELNSQGVQGLANPKNFQIVDLPINDNIIPGEPKIESGDASFHWLTHATELVMQGKAKALVTAPISKLFWHKAGHIYPGQTERLAELSGSKNPSMLFTAVSPHNGWRLNTLLATTHIPLAKIPEKLTPTLIESKLNTLLIFCKKFKLNTLLNFCKKFKSNPTLAVAGLNPHAGEEGSIGNEELEWMMPLLKKWRALHPKLKIYGPVPPDTCWISTAYAWQNGKNPECPDGILA